MNTPYVKEYDANGVVTNPITKDNPYLHQYPNRKARKNRQPRFMGNNKGVNLLLMGKFGEFKYLKVMQRIGNKVIFHTIPQFNYN